MITDDDIETLRAWVRDHGKYLMISEKIGYPFDSLTKFATGAVSEPRLKHLQALFLFKDEAEEEQAAFKEFLAARKKTT